MAIKISRTPLKATKASPVLPPLRRNKFNISPKEQRTLDNIVFDSKWEMKVYQMFKEAALDFTRQPRYVLQPKFEHNGRKLREIAYEADFLVSAGGLQYVVDAKGMETDVFKMKEKMLLFVHHIALFKLRTKKHVIEFLNLVAPSAQSNTKNEGSISRHRRCSQ